MLVTAVSLILALLAWICSSSPAGAEPISTAIGLTAIISTIGVSTAVAGAIGGAVISAGIGIGISLIAKAMAPQTADGEPATESGVQSSLRVGADVRRNRVFGKQLTAGQLAYWNLYGPDNKWLQLVFVLGSGPHDLFGVLGDGKRLTLGAMEGTTGFPIVEYNYGGQTLGWVRFYSGFEDQAADPELVSGAVPPGRWSAANVGKGVCYARVTLFYWPETFQNGIPQLQFEIGARVYDPRLDGSSGGVGAHRWSDPHTWAWSDNPAVIAYNFERGLYVGGQRVHGRGLAPIDLVRTMFVDAANVCDELVALAAGGTEKRYRIGINVGADRDLKSVEQELMIAMAGSMVEVGGAFGPLAGTAKEAAAVLTDADFVTGRMIKFSQKKPRDQIINALFGSYSDPAQAYQAVPYAPRTSSADEADDGERFQAQRDYVMIQSQTQAQRIGEIERRDARFQGSATGTLPFKFSYLEAGDWVQWTSARRQFNNKWFRIKSHRIAGDQTVDLALDETDPFVFDFDPAIDELDPLHPGDLPGIGALISMVPDFAMDTLQLDGVGSLTIPALRALWSPITDRTIDDVIVQYRVGVDDGTVKIAPPFRPTDGEGIITDGVQAGTGYQARAVLTSTPARPMFWTEWVPVTSASQHVVPSSVVSIPGDVTLQSFEQGLRDYVGQQLANGFERAARFEQWIASYAAEQEAANWLDLQITKRTDVNIRGQVDAISGGKVWRGPYSAAAEYFPNDMVQMPDGSLWWTPEKVTGIAPPAAPWVEEITAAILAEQWIAFAGTDGATAQTSESIETRFGTATLNRTVAQIINDWVAFAGPTYAAAQTSTSIETRFGAAAGDAALPLSLASLTAHWKAYAGADFAAAQTSDEIQAKFTSVDVTTGNLNTGMATITTQWQAFAGPDGSAAQTSDQILAQFNTLNASTGGTAAALATLDSQWKAFAGPDGAAVQTSDAISAKFVSTDAAIGTTNSSLATLTSQWQVFAGPDSAVSQSQDTMTAAINNNSASISTLSSATAGINGQLAATWQVKTDVNNYVAGLKLYNGGEISTFTIIADHFNIAQPGVGGGAAVPTFQIANVDGSAKLTMRGDMFADGTIVANKISAGQVNAIHVGANQIVASAANIANLVVENVHIKNAQITVAGFGTHGGGALGSISLDVPITVFGVGGSQIILQVFGGFDFSGVGGLGACAYTVTLLQTGAQMARGQASQAEGFNLSQPISGGTTVTAAAGGNTLTARLTVSYAGGAPVQCNNVRLGFVAYLR